MTQNSSPQSGVNNNDLSRQAQAQIDAGHYKEAIALYKKLLQKDDNAEWYGQIAYCYLERAKNFAARGMIKEALVLWESYTQYATPPYQDSDHYLLWLIATNEQTRVQDHLKQLDGRQLDKDYPGLAAILGLLILTRYPRLQQAIAEDSVFSKHLQTVQSALDSQTLDDLLGLLKGLPYRSVFRELRSLAKASQLASVSPSDVCSLLDKFSGHSPYRAAADLLRISTYQGAQLAEQMACLNEQQRHVLAEIKGLSHQQLELIDAYSEHHGLLTDQIKFDLIIKFHSLFGDVISQRLCLTLLNQYPAGKKDYRSSFGEIDEFESHRLKALYYEQKHQYQDAEPHWRRCIKQLEHKGGDSLVKIALILRHMAENQSDPAQANELRIDSLEYDRDDKASLLQILRYYSQSEDSSEQYQHWLAKGLTQFPEDSELLTIAIETAVREKAFRQAVEYADALLTIDSLNGLAKQTLFTGHLIRARELLIHNPQEAEQELETAGKLKSGKPQALRIQLLRALLTIAGGDNLNGLERLSETLSMLHDDPINRYFQAAIEARLCNLSVEKLLQAIATYQDYRLNAQELTTLIRQISHYESEVSEHTLIREALEDINTPLVQSLPDFSTDGSLLISFCQTIEKIGAFDLIQSCIDCVEESWEKPIWVYYQIYCDTQGDPGQCDRQHEHLLTTSLNKAKSDKDPLASVLIEHYLDRYHDSVETPTLEQFQSAGPVEQLFAHVSDDIRNQIDVKVEALCQQVSPEQLIEDLSPEHAKNSKLLVSIVNDPNLYTALMMLKAAEELSIDVGISVDEVLSFFNVDKPARRFFSFPFKF